VNRSTPGRAWVATLAGLLLVGPVLAGCAGSTGADDLRPAPPHTAPRQPGNTHTTPPKACDPVASYAPTTTPGASVAAIRDSGALVVAVSADTYLMGARNPVTGDIEGFDIDMASYVAQAIFGERGHLRLRVITSAERVSVLENHEVDLVARAFTMNCARWEQVAFSAEYYHAGQKVLVSTDSPATSLATLTAGSRVCAPAGTTTLSQLQSDHPRLTPVPAATHTGCLALFQQGEVDAVTGDDTILAGLAAQDPYAHVVGAAVSDEPYGLGVAADRQDLVQFVNAVLEQVKADGRWTASYERWLSVLGPAPAPPQAVYGR